MLKYRTINTYIYSKRQNLIKNEIMITLINIGYKLLPNKVDVWTK